MLRQIKVADLCKEFEDKLIQLKYSDDSLRRYRKVFGELQEYAGDCYYSQSIGTDFLVKKFNQLGGFVTGGEHSKNEMYYFRAIRSLADYYNFGTLFRRNGYHGEIIWPQPFKDVTENFLRNMVEAGYSRGYIERCKAVLCDLFLSLDSAYINSLDLINADLLSKLISSYLGLAPAAIAAKISCLRQFFKYAYLNGYTERAIHEFLPKSPPRMRIKLPNVWTEEEIEKIIHGVDITAPTGKRDYALILMTARLGMRIGDVLSLKLEDIDWDNKIISIVQNKTKEPLTLPLPNDVGWAIIDYLKNGRPITESHNIFVAHNAPYQGFPSHRTLYGVIRKVIKRSGIHVDTNKPVGWHTLRHSLATNLLRNNVEKTTISDILGHSDPESVKHYLQVDIDGLRKCALEVEVKAYVKK